MLTREEENGSSPSRPCVPSETRRFTERTGLLLLCVVQVYNFNIGCGVRRKPAKLNLNLKGEGYMIHSK